MITIKTMQHIATCKTVSSFRSVKSLSQLDMQPQDRGRQTAGRAQVVTQDMRRQWIQQMWRQNPLRR